jgi:hypothetical protein
MLKNSQKVQRAKKSKQVRKKILQILTLIPMLNNKALHLKFFFQFKHISNASKIYTKNVKSV